MQYKTITLELIQANATMHEYLRQKHTLLETLNRLATELRDRHLELTAGSEDDPLVKSQAMEVAVYELQQLLDDGSIEFEV